MTEKLEKIKTSKVIRTETGSDNFGPWVDIVFQGFGTYGGEAILVKSHQAWFKNIRGKTTISYQVKLEGAPVWIGDFSHPLEAAAFYLERPQ